MVSKKLQPQAKRIITRADDVGSFHSANMAIMEAYKKGVLRNGSFLVPGGRFKEAVEMFKNEKGFCIGLHAALTCEWSDVRWKPVLPPDKIPSIVRPDGTLHYGTMDLFKNGARHKHMLMELQAQLDKARKNGLDVRYADSHMDFMWLFETSDQHRFSEVFHAWAKKEGLISQIKLTGGIPSLAKPKSDPVEDLAERIRMLKAGTYLLVNHPCYDDGEMRSTQLMGQPVGTEAKNRDMQRRMFMDPVIRQAFSTNGVKAIRYTEA